jgi:hypothetical protein
VVMRCARAVRARAGAVKPGAMRSPSPCVGPRAVAMIPPGQRACPSSLATPC